MSVNPHLDDGALLDQVERQLVRLQNSRHFHNSRRYPSFLNYVVRKTLTGCHEDLKERVIGVEAFGRQPGYDLNADPVVRVTAGEVRKRLAQYYYEPEHTGELRIELRPGSYVPEFKFAQAQAVASSSAEASLTDEASELALPAQLSPQLDVPDRISTPKKRKYLQLASLGALLLMASVLFASAYLRTSAQKLFWRPILQNRGPVLISVGSVLALTNEATPGISDASVGGHALHSDPVALADTIALAKIQEVLSGQSKVIKVQSSAQTSFSDLQKGPVILICGFNNAWTMRLTDPLLFHFARPSINTFEIEDRADQKRNWSVNTLSALNKVTDDYGLIARFYDPVTEQVIVVVAGIGENGTIAGANALSDERTLEQLKQSGFLLRENSNFEAVVQVRMIDGEPGRPKIVATDLW